MSSHIFTYRLLHFVLVRKHLLLQLGAAGSVLLSTVQGEGFGIQGEQGSELWSYLSP